MFFDILYFFSMTGFCVTTTGALLYIYDKDLATKIAYSIGQYGLNACAYTLDFVENIQKRDVSEDFVILYNYGKTTIIESSLLYENDVKNKDLVIFRKTKETSTYYKIIYDINDFEVNNIEKPFLQVEIRFSDEKIEIQDILRKFYVSGNKFDKIFFKWFMEYFFQKNIGDVWQLNIIDDSVNVIQLTQDNVIVLNGNKYSIENI